MSSGDVLQEKYNVIFVLGAPGSGKGTQCTNINQHFGYEHLSAGELLREERNQTDSTIGQMINKHMVEGSIVPVKITCSLIEKAMKKSGKKKFLVDGFPRNQDNLDGWNEEMSTKTNIQLVICIDCDDKTCVKRCLSRGSGRVDDNEVTLMKRLTVFREQSMPIIEYFDKKNLVFKVDGNKSKEEVFELLKERISKL